MLEAKGHPNHLGIWGWLGGGSWGPERYLYTLHRVTGLGLLAYFLLHIVRDFLASDGANGLGRSDGGGCRHGVRYR